MLKEKKYKRKERAFGAQTRYNDNILRRDYIPMSDELKITNLNKEYSWEKKYQVVGLYMELQSLQKTATLAKVSSDTISKWKKQAWWPEVEQRVLREKALEHDTKLTKIINKALDLVEDRLVNGEQVLNNKTGTLVHKPVSLRDTTNALGALSARQKNIRAELSEQTEDTASINETLSILAKEFAKWAHKKKPEIIDLEDIDAKFPTVASEARESREDEDFQIEMENEESPEDFGSSTTFSRTE